ncbi:hypothetical protein FA15DRAFT_682941 [Coprinopsis marcescibilis]|uniref:NTF2-domain-containing protein n=1 Tax=Coprinopsis marcescibilis TaxID=230819 RepID=A0A5C3KI26_COPMA|nr:hypothetical protein FA15DRAFT_682941 [Coprinopsis marcescibilis]
MTTSAATSNGPHHQNVVPSEVGWQFVPQYYTFVNKEPHRLHCFYKKESTFIHGTEGEEGKPCYGQQEIHKKISAIGFQDCKVFIHSVDAQSSANGGIIIQVIGEMSNRNEPWRKFVQTFFLAEQPNGYFVLNDIFRFLKEEAVEADETDDAGEAAEVPTTAAPEPVSVVEPVFVEPLREPTPPPAAVPAPEPVVAAPVPEPPKEVVEPAPAPAPEAPVDVPAPAAAPQVNGTPAVVEPEQPAPPVAAEKSREPTPAPAPQQAPAPSPAPQLAPSTSTTTPSAPPAQPAAPPGPRTWASLAASNQKKWGSVAQESRGITETPASPAPSSGTQTPSQPHPQTRPAPHAGQRHEHPAYLAAQNIATPHCFIKGVTEPISDVALKTLLTQRFGPIKEIDIVRNKACAFLEFQTLESAKRAIVASLNQGQGGEGGVFVETPDAGSIRIVIETKKERSDRPPPGAGRGRGGVPINGDARGGGSFRGRGGQRGGRGIPGPAK